MLSCQHLPCCNILGHLERKLLDMDKRSHYEILGLLPNASREQVKEAYHQLARQWHPDRVAHNPKLQAIAQEEMKAINAAYGALKSYQPASPLNPSVRSTQPKQEGVRAAEETKRREETERRQQEAKLRQREAERRRVQEEAEAAHQRERLVQAKEEARRKEQEAKRVLFQQLKSRERSQANAPQNNKHNFDDLGNCVKCGRSEAAIKYTKWSCGQLVGTTEDVKVEKAEASKGEHVFSGQGDCIRCGRSRAAIDYTHWPCRL